jgi:lysophospholipase L1-like esterase
LSLLALTCLGADAPPSGRVIFDMNTVSHPPGEFAEGDRKVKAGTAELMDGKVGRAVRFTFVEGARGGFMTGRVRDASDWNAADGFSFWVKGDGSSSWGGIELIDRDDFSLRYGYCFPIDSTEWRRIVVPWRDVIPELSGPLVDANGGMPPHRFGYLSFGKWYYWRDYPAESFAIDQVALEPKIAPDAPPADAPALDLSRLREKLRNHQPITIVTMGDSLTDEHHWSNRQVVWHRLLAEALRQKYGVEAKVVNPAIGGTTLSQNLILMPRWSKDAPSPDLVTVWFGGNDYDSGVRRPRFGEYLRLAVDRIRRQTQGRADVLLMTTCPSHGRWDANVELEQAVRDVAAEKHTGLADVAAAFRKAGNADAALGAGYWVDDKIHLGPKGHALTRDTVMGAIEGKQ